MGLPDLTMIKRALTDSINSQWKTWWICLSCMAIFVGNMAIYINHKLLKVHYVGPTHLSWVDRIGNWHVYIYTYCICNYIIYIGGSYLCIYIYIHRCIG